MDKRDAVVRLIKSQGLLPLYFHEDVQVSILILKALYDAGVRVAEYTNRGKAALSNFKALRRFCETDLPGMLLGAGTIKNSSSADQFIAAGADFLVSPGFAEDVFDTSYSAKILWIPGCMTPTEIMRAEKFGITLIKLFPGNVLGAGFMTAMKDIFPGIDFMPTGGVEPGQESLKKWFDAGVCAVGMSSKWGALKSADEADFAGLTTRTKAVLNLIKEIRK